MSLLSGRRSQSVSFNGSPFFARGSGWEISGGGADRKKWEGGIERRAHTGPMSADTEFTLRALRRSSPADRASGGRSEITLSPSRCVQSKLQFKSSCQTLFLSSSRFSFSLLSLSFSPVSSRLAATFATPLSLPVALQAAGIRNTENSSSSTAD